jgi:hypothetical protein
MYFMKQLIYFDERNVCAGKKQMLCFTTLPGNWPLWWSEILCKILFYYSNGSNTAPCSNRLYTFQTTFIQCHQTECNHFSVHLCRMQQALMVLSQKFRYYINWYMEYSPFISQNSKGVFHYPSCSSQNVVIYTFQTINFCWDVAIAHVLIRQTTHQPQAQMAWKILLRH